MFSFPRFSRLAQWTVQRSPAWYLFVHFVACCMITIITYLIFDEKQSIWYSPVPFVNPFHFLYGFGWANGLAMLPVAAHFVSRHFQNDRNSTDYLTLPVSALERFIVLFIGLFVVLPAIAWMSSVIFFVFVQLFGTDGLQFPYFKWMWSSFSLALLPYFAGAIILFALGLIRSQLTLLWGLGIILIVGAIAAVVSQTVFDQVGVDALLDLENDTAIIDNFYGPFLGGKHVHVYAGHEIFNQVPLLIGTAILSIILFITSAWRSLNAKEV